MHTTRLLGVLLGWVMGWVMGLGLAASGTAAPPNILLIMTDDQGAGDLGIAGNPVLDTPRIDGLARESVWFTRFYVEPVCTPTRAALMTGRYSPRTGAIDTFRSRAMMFGDEVTIAEELGKLGYRTGIFGKWHLGDCYPMRPIDQGFDEALVHRGGGLAQSSDAIGNDRRYTDAILVHNGEEVQTRGYCMDVYTQNAIAFMEESVEEDRPFFAYVATNTPHDPFHDVPEDLYQKYLTKDLSLVSANERRHDAEARIFAMVENIDQNVGHLLDALERLDVERETIVVYMHDNGPATDRYVGEMRGRKSQVYEGGIRTPLFVRWPGQFASQKVDTIAAHVDVLPTLVEAAGGEVDEQRVLDGRSLMALLDGSAERWPERSVFIQAHRGDARVARHQFAVIGERFKLLRASGFGREGLPDDAPAMELYDVLADPYERHDLAGERPELVAEMLAAHDRWFEDVTGERVGRPRIVIGTEHETTTVLTRNDWQPSEGGGRWRLSVLEPVRMDVRVLFNDAVGSPRVRLTYGRWVREVSSEGAHEFVELGSIELESGDLELRIEIESENGKVVPGHVILSRAR